MQVGDLVRDPLSGTIGIIIGEVLEDSDRWFIQWNDGDMYSLNHNLFEVISENR